MTIKENLEDILRIVQKCFDTKIVPGIKITFGDYMEVNLSYTEYDIEDIAAELNEIPNLELDYENGGYQACVYYMIPNLGTIMFKQRVEIDFVEGEDDDKYFNE